MIKIRLARHGKNGDPAYRIVAISGERKQSGKTLSVLGHWHPRTDLLKIDKKRIAEWESKGAQVSAAVKELVEKK